MADEQETSGNPGEVSAQHGPPPFKRTQVTHINLPANHKRFDPHSMKRQVTKIDLPAGHKSFDPLHRPVIRIDKPAEK